MKKILVTGGTVFVSRTLAEYFVAKGDEVYVLNRNNKPQSKGVILIEADRYNLDESLRNYEFDVVIDANSYTGEEMTLLLDALPTVKDYVFISTSAVYPDVSKQPFTEKTEVGFNNYWTNYGTNKIEAENILISRIPGAFILRPAYIYGPYNNAYREAFVFDCAKNKHPFYLPKTGEMKLQFIHMHDICRLVDSLLTNQPEQKIYNVGNEEAPSIKEWVSMCYEIVGETPEFIEVMDDISPLKYFSFADYQYLLNVDHQMEMIKTTIDFKEGLKESWAWYQNNENLVNKRDYQLFIDENLA
ncbi:NAD-dependent epimerase/dehydratase family protein [Vagococcus fluvialis]|uniref:NAD-dependent epimerase/dehydratase family protein n=1 Tax=Vagococcus fluvialis TaxID=2738 RepID=UPI003D0EEE02